MLLHEVNKQLVDLRFSEFDESELDELKAKKSKLKTNFAKAESNKNQNMVLLEKHHESEKKHKTKLATAKKAEKPTDKIEADLKKNQRLQADAESLIEKHTTIMQSIDTEIAVVDAHIQTQTDEYEEEKRAGRARFSKKTFIDYKGKNRRPPYHFTWVRYTPTSDPPFRDFTQWTTGYEYTPVKYGKDPFYPIGALVNAANYWQFQDVVWVKRDLKAYLLDKIKEKKEQMGGKELIDRLNRQFEKQDKYAVEKEYQNLHDMEKQIKEHEHAVDDSVLTSLGI